jgi:hypothetical protein
MFAIGVCSFKRKFQLKIQKINIVDLLYKIDPDPFEVILPTF